MDENILKKYLEENTLIDLTKFKALNSHQPKWLQSFECGEETQKYVIIIWPSDCTPTNETRNDIISYYVFTRWVNIAIKHWDRSRTKKDKIYETVINKQNILESIILYCIEHTNEKEFSSIFETLETIMNDLEKQGLLDKISIEYFIYQYTNSSTSSKAAHILERFLEDNKINLKLIFLSIIENNLNKLYRSIQISTYGSPIIPRAVPFDQIPINNIFKHETYELIDEDNTSYKGIIYKVNL